MFYLLFLIFPMFSLAILFIIILFLKCHKRYFSTGLISSYFLFLLFYILLCISTLSFNSFFLCVKESFKIYLIHILFILKGFFQRYLFTYTDSLSLFLRYRYENTLTSHHQHQWCEVNVTVKGILYVKRVAFRIWVC